MILVAIATKFEIKRNSFAKFQTNQIKTHVILHFFSLSCSIASMTSYLSENEAKNLQNGDVHLAQIPVFEMEYNEKRLAH